MGFEPMNDNSITKISTAITAGMLYTGLNPPANDSAYVLHGYSVVMGNGCELFAAFALSMHQVASAMPDSGSNASCYEVLGQQQRRQ